jgi:hypothetical protein
MTQMHADATDLADRLKGKSILDQDFFDHPAFELEVIGHLATQLSWKDGIISCPESGKEHTPKGTFTDFIELVDIEQESNYVAEVGGSKADIEATRMFSRYENSARIKRLQQRKLVWVALTDLRSMIQQSMDYFVGIDTSVSTLIHEHCLGFFPSAGKFSRVLAELL